MKIHKTVTVKRIETAIMDDYHAGFCIACGADAEGCEPDACGYKCESCGEAKVYGAEEVLLMVF
jgi:hypothetical protein